VDCTVHHSLCTNHDVESYPTFKFIQHRAMHDYLGARSKEVNTMTPATVVWSPASHLVRHGKTGVDGVRAQDARPRGR